MVLEGLRSPWIVQMGRQDFKVAQSKSYLALSKNRMRGIENLKSCKMRDFHLAEPN